MKAQQAKQKLKIVFSFINIFILCSCYDMGEYENVEQYCDTFSQVRFVCQSTTTSPTIRKYDMDELYNTDTAKNLTKVVTEDKYKYIVVDVDSDVYIEDIVMWLYSDSYSGDIVGEIYIEDSFPSIFSGLLEMEKEAGKYEATKARIYHGEKIIDTYYANFSGFGDVDDGEGHTSTYETELKADGLEVTYILSYESMGEEVEYLYVCKFPLKGYSIDYSKFSCIQYDNKTNTELTSYNFFYKGEYGDEPEGGLTNKVGTFKLTLGKEIWNSFMVSEYSVAGSSKEQIKVTDGDYIFFKFINNTPYAYRQNLEEVSFTANNIMIRSVKNEKEY